MKRFKPIYVIAGKEESFVNEKCRQMLDELVEPSERATGLFKADPKEVTAADILDELRTAPFLTNKRVVVIKGADDFVSQNRELLEKYFDNPCPTGVLILTVNTWQSNTRLAKKLPKAGKLVTVTQPKPYQLPARLMQYTSDAHSKRLSKDAAELLVELVGDDLVRITTGYVEKLIGHNRIFGAFEVIDKCLAGNAGAAVERLRNMFASDRSTEFKVVGAFAFHFRRMFNAKVLLEKGVRQAEIINQLRIWGNKDSFFAQLRKMTLKQIGDGIQQLAGIDYAIKTGRTKPQIAIEQLVLTMVTDSGTR
ncbi:MAG: DNA polymerase III subunit delta [Planctomycetota bacterium]|jgi:DNA polymerase-3 subunit delta